VKRLGKNHGAYHGETIDIRAVLREIEDAAKQHGWISEVFHKSENFDWIALRRAPILIRNLKSPIRIYISTGIHGDEPAGPLAALKLIQENRWPEYAEIFLLP
jgi:predicted deacylase